MDVKTVEKVADLARLKLTQNEMETYAVQLNQVFKYFEQLQAVKTDGVEPLVTPTDMAQYWRADGVVEWKNAGEALEQAPERIGQLYKVPPVVG